MTELAVLTAGCLRRLFGVDYTVARDVNGRWRAVRYVHQRRPFRTSRHR